MNLSYYRKYFSDIADEFSEYSEEVRKRYGGSKFHWKLDMVWSLIRYGARPVDYNRFEFYRKSGRERSRYLTYYKYARIMKYTRRVLAGQNNVCANKAVEYEVYKDFINRPWFIADKDTTPDTIKDFIAKQGKVIAKDVKGEQGHSVLLLDKDSDLAPLMSELRDHTYVVEKALQNCKEFEEVNPGSLNTLRCVSMIDSEGNPHILSIILRAGVDAYVDNWGSGGIGYVADIDTGIVAGYGVDKKNGKHVYHPSTNKNMMGFKIPRYEEVKEMVRKMAVVDKRCRYVGWDVAVTPDGIELIEMNCPCGHDMLQAFGEPIGDTIKRLW